MNERKIKELEARIEEVENIRSSLSDVRHKINMMANDANAGSLEPCAGGVTCVIISLYAVIEEMKVSLAYLTK